VDNQTPNRSAFRKFMAWVPNTYLQAVLLGLGIGVMVYLISLAGGGRSYSLLSAGCLAVFGAVVFSIKLWMRRRG
jgi:hypothetical protein